MAKILIVSPTPFEPRNAGNRARIANLIDVFEQLQHDVHFLHVEREAGATDIMQARLAARFHRMPYVIDLRRARPKLKRLLNRVQRFFKMDAAYQVDVDAWYQDQIGCKVADLCEQHQFEVVVVEYVYLSKVFEQVPENVVKVIDTHDVFANRHRTYLQQGMQPVWFSCSLKDEDRALNRADIVCAIQEVEARDFANRIQATVVTLGYLPTIKPLPLPSSDQAVLLYIGSSNPINKLSITWFVEKVWPILRENYSIELLIAGTVCEDLTEAIGITLVGPVENLSEIYARSTIVINPAQLGTGLKVKTVESLAFGRTLVSTSTGLEGLINSSKPAWIEANTPTAFATAIEHVVMHESTLTEMSISAIDFVKQYTVENIESFRSALNHALSEATLTRSKI